MSATTTKRRLQVGKLIGSTPQPHERFLVHYRTHFANTGRSFEEYAPAYEYGSAVACDPRYRGYGWSTIEPELRRDWEMCVEGGAWRHVKEAVRYGWESREGER